MHLANHAEFVDTFAMFAVSMTENISPAKSVGRAAVLKPIDPVAPGTPSPPGTASKEISVAQLATAL